MSIFALFRKLLFFLPFVKVARHCEDRVSLWKIRAAKVYVHGVKKARLLAIALFLAVMALLLLLCGLIVLHVALFMYPGWSEQVKLIVLISLGTLEILVASGVIFFLLKEETWVRFSGIHKVIQCVTHKESDQPAAH